MSHAKRDSYSTANHSQERRHGNSNQVQVQPAYAQSPPNSLLGSGNAAGDATSISSPPRDRRGNQLAPLGDSSGIGTVRKAPGHHSTGLAGVAPKAAMGIPYAETGQKGAKRQVIGRAGETDAMEELMKDDEDKVEQYFHKKREHRLPPLPDFSQPPPIMRTGFRPPEKAPILGDYQAHNYKEYKRMMKEAAKLKLGGLGANITPEAEAAAEKRRKMFQYGSSVNAVNFALMDVPEPAGLYGSNGKASPNKVIPRKLTKEAELAEIKRQRALRYGEQFSAPVLKEKRSKAKTPQPDQHLLDELQKLEGKHKHDLEEIARIKAQLNLD